MTNNSLIEILPGGQVLYKRVNVTRFYFKIMTVATKFLIVSLLYKGNSTLNAEGPWMD